MLVVSALICLVELGDVAGWMVIVILAREFTITGLRTVAAAQGIVIARRLVRKDQNHSADDCRSCFTASELAFFLYWISFCNHYALGFNHHDHHIRCGIYHKKQKRIFDVNKHANNQLFLILNIRKQSTEL